RSGKRGGVTLCIAREVGMAGVRHLDTRLVPPFHRDLVAGARYRAAEHVESRPDVADAARCSRGDFARGLGHAVTMRRTSPRTPAAVTTAPAPGPDTTSGRSR